MQVVPRRFSSKGAQRSIQFCTDMMQPVLYLHDAPTPSSYSVSTEKPEKHQNPAPYLFLVTKNFSIRHRVRSWVFVPRAPKKFVKMNQHFVKLKNSREYRKKFANELIRGNHLNFYIKSF